MENKTEYEPRMSPFHRGKHGVGWVVSSEVDLVPSPKWMMVQDRGGDKVRVWNYLVSTRDGICEPF